MLFPLLTGRRLWLGGSASLLVLAGSISGLAAAASPAVGACPAFPANNVWNTDISGLPLHPSSAAWVGNMGGTSRLLHPDFGPSGGYPYGIPFNVVDSSHPKINISFQYNDESDQVPYPFGSDTSIEGGPNATGDRHAIMIDQSTCTLYELYNAQYNGSTGSTAGSGATWNLAGNALRPAGWTSADAAGLPIFPGLLRLEEVNSGSVRHAIRFTAQQTDRSYLWPARHQAGAASSPSLPPMGARFRLRAGYDISRFSAATQVVLKAMQHYGLILADNGSNWYFQGAAETGWSDTMISELKTIPAGQFDAVDESSLMIDPNSAQARQPAIAPPPPPARPAPIVAAAPPIVPSPIPSPTDTGPAPQSDAPRRVGSELVYLPGAHPPAATARGLPGSPTRLLPWMAAMAGILVAAGIAWWQWSLRRRRRLSRSSSRS
ncbi:MAG TPA: hypothetical protein VNV65_12955 [Candidatus Solibacter sp.]|nr:hypothetical protein [Candidatus Solibacter sp.]